MNETMVDRVAKAISDVFTAEHVAITAMIVSGVSQATISAMIDEMLDKCARAAIEAMRKPTKGMILAAETAIEDFTDEGYDSNGDGDRFPYTHLRPGIEAAVLRAMIAAALTET